MSNYYLQIGQTDEDFTRLKEFGVRCNLLVPQGKASSLLYLCAILPMTEQISTEKTTKIAGLILKQKSRCKTISREPTRGAPATPLKINRAKIVCRKQSKNVANLEKELACLALILCSDMGLHINGAIVDRNGNCVAL